MVDEGNYAVLFDAESVDISSDLLEHSYVFVTFEEETNPISFPLLFWASYLSKRATYVQ